MKFKNTFLSALRHTLTTVGGMLSVSPEPQTMAIGILLVAIGTGWGAKDEHSAENPGGKSSIGSGVAGLLVFACLGALASLGFTGCATGGGKVDPARAEARAYTLVNTAAVLVLADDPGAADELRSVAAGVDTVFTLGTLSPEQLNTFLEALQVPPEKRLLLAVALNNAYQLYTAETGRPLVDVNDPTAAAILKGVRRAINDALRFSTAFPPQTVSQPVSPSA
jgi:hypothetical protein